MISLRRPVSRRVDRTGGSDDPKLIAEVTPLQPKHNGNEGPASLHSNVRPDGRADIGDAECERAYVMRAKPLP